MAKRAVLLAAILLGGCAAQEPVTRYETKEVKEKVPVMPDPPTRLKNRWDVPTLPRFVPPDHPKSSACLTPAGERRTKILLDALRSRMEAWRAYWIANSKQGQSQ